MYYPYYQLQSSQYSNANMQNGWFTLESKRPGRQNYPPKTERYPSAEPAGNNMPLESVETVTNMPRKVYESGGASFEPEILDETSLDLAVMGSMSFEAEEAENISPVSEVIGGIPIETAETDDMSYMPSPVDYSMPGETMNMPFDLDNINYGVPNGFGGMDYDIPNIPGDMGYGYDMQNMSGDMGFDYDMPNISDDTDYGMQFEQDGMDYNMSCGADSMCGPLQYHKNSYISAPIAEQNDVMYNNMLPTMENIQHALTDYLYTSGYLRKQIGKLVKVEFFIGSSQTDREGILLEVGASYIVLQSPETEDKMMCDLSCVKFVTIMSSGANENMMDAHGYNG